MKIYFQTKEEASVFAQKSTFKKVSKAVGKRGKQWAASK